MRKITYTLIDGTTTTSYVKALESGHPFKTSVVEIKAEKSERSEKRQACINVFGKVTKALAQKFNHLDNI